MRIIKITESKKEKLTDCIGKMVKFGKKAMQELEDLDDDDMGERDEDDADFDDDDDMGYRNGGGMGQRRYRREGGMGERRSRTTGRFIR